MKMPPVKHYSSSEVNQYELSSRLLTLTENTSYTLTQINGQRIYRKAPHAWSGPEPSRSCEVFIGRIPHDCFEDTLVPLFQQAGELFEFRLMINFSGWNRGYAFAMYTTELEASNAIRLFNNYMIRPSWQLGVCPSINNCRIFISRIPPTTPSAEIVRLLYALTDEVQEVRIRRSMASCAAIVEYKSHRGAAMARKALVAAAAAAWGGGARPAVDWSLPQSPQLLKQYREVGRWSAERGVELSRAEEAICNGGPQSYTLEPWSQARRLRMIYEAQRAHAPPAPHAMPPTYPQRDNSTEWFNGQAETLAAAMFALQLSGSNNLDNLSGTGGLGGQGGVWAPPPPAAAPPAPFNPWTARHPLAGLIQHKMVVCDKWVALKVVEFLVCVACLVAKRISADDEVRLSLLLQKLSREWSLLTSVTWDNIGGSFADAVYGGYTIITFGLLLARIFQEIPKGRRILEGFLLGLGMLFFLIIGGLELASLDSIPPKLVVNASILGALSLVVAVLFLIDLMAPRVYTATKTAQTDTNTVNVAIVNNDIKKNSNALQHAAHTQLPQNGHLGNGHLPHDKQNGNVNNEKQNAAPNGQVPNETDLGKKNDKNISKDEIDSMFDVPKDGFKASSPLDPEGIGKSKFGSLRDDFEGGNYVRLSDPMAEPDKIHYERELAKFNENYFRNYLETNLDDYAGRFIVKEGYLPEPHTPAFAKSQTGRLKSLYDDVSPAYEKKRSTSKSPTRVRTVATPTLQQLEDYLRSPSRTRRSETPLFPIDETGRDLYEDGRASGTPTDPGYVQYTAGKWPDKREIRTPRHSPTE